MDPTGPAKPWALGRLEEPHGRCMLYQDGTCMPSCHPHNSDRSRFTCAKACFQQAAFASQRAKTQASECTQEANDAESVKTYLESCEASANGCSEKCRGYFEDKGKQRWWGWPDKALGERNAKAQHEVGAPRPDFVAICGMTKRVYCCDCDKPDAATQPGCGEICGTGLLGETGAGNKAMSKCSVVKDAKCLRVCPISISGREYGTGGGTEYPSNKVLSRAFAGGRCTPCGSLVHDDGEKEELKAEELCADRTVIF